MTRFVLSWVAALLVVACGGAEQPAGPQPVSVEQWCEAVGASMCGNTADKCFSGLAGVADGCRETFTPSCTRGRDAGAMSGRTSDDLTACTSYIESRSCEELGFDTGQAMTGSGSFAQLCTLEPPP